MITTLGNLFNRFDRLDTRINRWLRSIRLRAFRLNLPPRAVKGRGGDATKELDR